jgi:hypothetical protein
LRVVGVACIIEHTYDLADSPQSEGVPPSGSFAPAPCLAELQDGLDRLAALDCAGLDEAEQLDHLAVLERFKAGLAAAQARVTMALVHTRTGARRQTASLRIGAVVAWPRRSPWPDG